MLWPLCARGTDCRDFWHSGLSEQRGGGGGSASRRYRLSDSLLASGSCGKSPWSHLGLFQSGGAGQVSLKWAYLKCSRILQLGLLGEQACRHHGPRNFCGINNFTSVWRDPKDILEMPLAPWTKDLFFLVFVLFSSFLGACKTCLTTSVTTVLKPLWLSWATFSLTADPTDRWPRPSPGGWPPQLSFVKPWPTSSTTLWALRRIQE